MNDVRQLGERLDRGEVFLTEAAVVERMRREFEIPADKHLVYGGALYDRQARDALSRIYRGYIEAAGASAMPLLLTSSTSRTSPETIAASRFAGRPVLRDWMTFLAEVRSETASDVFIGGLVGPRGDAYQPSQTLSGRNAADFHRGRCQELAEAGAEFLMAATLPALSEALGVAAAMGETRLPAIVSFIVDRSGMLLDGTPLATAITAIDEASPPLCYSVNCVHPANLLQALKADVNRGRESLSRLKGIQANASLLSPTELDNSAELRREDAASLAEHMVSLRADYAFQIFGGCCGTDATDLEQIATRLRTAGDPTTSSALNTRGS